MTDNTFDNLTFSNSFSTLGEQFFSRVTPTPFETAARLVHFNTRAAGLLDLDPALQQNPVVANIFSGKQPLPGGDPIAMLYAGHQFGHSVPQLGDGRAIMLGEVTNQRGEKWEIQL